MAPDAMLQSMSTRLARFVFFAFGLAAVSALLAQPICEAAERRAAHASDTSHLAASGGDDVISPALPASAAAPPLVPGYYVRSARIQR